ncbi:unnamed protein product [Rhodiola kirilowii]
MEISEKEIRCLLGEPTFIDLGNGRVKCVETGHELPTKELETYARSKRCRSGLIDAALLQNKPPLNAFKLDPLSRSKLICKLTGATINKSEEHIWKHINGKQFLNKLGQAEFGLENETRKLQTVVAPNSKNKRNEEKEKGIAELVSGIREAQDNSDSEEGDGFWVPPVGAGCSTGSDSEEETTQDSISEECAIVSKELSKRTKRMTIEIGPNSFATRKKKNRPNTTTSSSM